jgi:hypothetical protein
VSGVLVLLHIPKTAGTTLAGLMRFHYGPRFRGAANALKDPAAAEARLAAIGGRSKFRATAGHVTAGMVDAALPDASVVTILRDPVERTLSHYDFLVRPSGRRRKQAGVGLTPPGLQPPPPDLSLADALGSYVLDNLQTRMLCGIVSPYDELPGDALERAKANLGRFAFVGTTERFDELLTLMNRELGWPATAYRAARTNTRPAPDEEARRLAAEHNALDAELHAYASTLLPTQDATVVTEAVRIWNGGEGDRTPEVEAALASAQAADAATRRRKRRRKAKSNES